MRSDWAGVWARFAAVACALVLVLIYVRPAVAGQTEESALSLDTFFSAAWTYQLAWSPDGEFLSYLSDDWVHQTVYVVPSNGGDPISISGEAEFIGDPSFGSAGQPPSWSPDGDKLLYVRDGDLFQVAVGGDEVTRLTETREQESDARFSPDGTRVAFSRGGDLWVLDLTTAASRQLTFGGHGDGAPSWSPSGALIAFRRLPRDWVSWSPDYSGELLSYHWGKPSDDRDVGIVRADGGDVRWVARSEQNERLFGWSPDGEELLISRRSIDVKDRVLIVASADGASERVLYEQHDDKYLPSQDQHAFFSPDGRHIVFTSDADGWNHLYLAASDGSSVRQLTAGAFEVSYPQWASDARELVFCSTENGTEQRQIYKVDVESGERTQITTLEGVNTAVTLSPDGTRIAFLHSDPVRLPDVWIQPFEEGATPRQVTNSMPEELAEYSWQVPEIVSYPSRVDGTEIKAQLFSPRHIEPDTRYPAIVMTHQAAIYQEVYLGPGPAKDNVAWYGFHQRLADRGYVVLNVDYRGSYGYGRDFRVGNYRDLGGDDAVDVVSGIDYLADLGYVDTSRVGVYGMSYGGHMVLTLLTKHPNVFRAGVDIAGVADFVLNYESLYGPWILGRLGTPETDANAYHEASAINFVSEMQSPLLILHGTNDPNVTILQSVLLVDRLLAQDKAFEFEIYPGELHFFSKKESWLDAFPKMESFFDRHVRDAE